MDSARPDLTGSEQMLLDLVRAGRYNAEIAVQLGVPTGEVMRRIDALCRKLGTADRAALREWEPGAEVVVADDARESAEDARPRRQARGPRFSLGTSSVLIATAATAVFGIVVALRQDDSVATGAGAPLLEDGTETPAATVAPSATESMPELPVESLRVLNGAVIQRGNSSSTAVDFPTNAMFFVHEFRGDRLQTGDPSALIRYWLDSTGELHRDTVFEGAPGGRANFLQSGARLWASICDGPPCKGDPGEATTRFSVSEDAGTTWTLVREEPGPWILLAAMGDNLHAINLTTGAAINPHDGNGWVQWGDAFAQYFSASNVRDALTGAVLLDIDDPDATIIDARPFGDEVAALFFDAPFETWTTPSTLPLIGLFEDGRSDPRIILRVPELATMAVRISGTRFIGDTRPHPADTTAGILVDFSSQSSTIQPIAGIEGENAVVIGGFAWPEMYVASAVPPGATCKEGPAFLGDPVPCPPAGTITVRSLGGLIDESEEVWRRLSPVTDCDWRECDAPELWVAVE